MQLNILKKICLISLLSIFLSEFSASYAEEAVTTDESGNLSLHVWDRYVRRFRRDHNLSLFIDYGSAKWNIEKFGDLANKSYWLDQGSIIAEYSFHILISGKTGYFLGSSFGYTYVRPNKLENEFQASSSWLLPGVNAGIAYNYDPSGRFFAGIGAQLARFNDLRTHRKSGESQSASITGEMLQMFLGVDLFFSLDTALRIAWADSTTYFPRPIASEDFIVNAHISRRVQGGQLGLTYHFL